MDGRAEIKNIPQAIRRKAKDTNLGEISRYEFYSKDSIGSFELRDESVGIRASSVTLVEGLY